MADVTQAPPGPQPTTNLRRAVVLMSGSSVLVPLAGVLTQPVLARALGATGRGEMMAAIAPAVLAGSVVTLGLPDALTYLTAKKPWVTRQAIAWASALSVALGILAVFVVWAILPILTDGNARLGRLMLLAMVLSIPTLVVGAARGAAMGHQMWGAVAAESIISTSLRVVVFVGLWITGDLTPLIAVVMTFTGPIVACFVYWPVLRAQRGEGDGAPREKVLRPLVSYGTRTWFGSVAGILGTMIGPILMVPLASVRELGLYTVATTVMDVPIILALAIAAALRGVSSRSNDVEQVASTTRIVSLLGLLGCAVLAFSTPFWLPALFGSQFDDAVLPTQILFGVAALYIPGPMAAAGLAAFGRPGLRSVGFGLAVVVNLGGFILLVPAFGILGACWAGVASAAVGSVFLLVAASRALHLPIRALVVPRRSDISLAWREGLHLAQKALGRSPAPHRTSGS